MPRTGTPDALDDLAADLRRALLVDARRAAREDQTLRLVGEDGLERRAGRDDLGVHAEFAEPACDQVCELRAEINDEYGVPGHLPEYRADWTTLLHELTGDLNPTSKRVLGTVLWMVLAVSRLRKTPHSGPHVALPARLALGKTARGSSGLATRLGWNSIICSSFHRTHHSPSIRPRETRCGPGPERRPVSWPRDPAFSSSSRKGGIVWGINAQDGSAQWKTTTNVRDVQTVRLDGNRVFIGGASGLAAAVVSTGELRFDLPATDVRDIDAAGDLAGPDRGGRPGHSRRARTAPSGFDSRRRKGSLEPPPFSRTAAWSSAPEAAWFARSPRRGSSAGVSRWAPECFTVPSTFSTASGWAFSPSRASSTRSPSAAETCAAALSFPRVPSDRRS